MMKLFGSEVCNDEGRPELASPNLGNRLSESIAGCCNRFQFAHEANHHNSLPFNTY
jgi:hypothetical protein